MDLVKQLEDIAEHLETIDCSFLRTDDLRPDDRNLFTYTKCAFGNSPSIFNIVLKNPKNQSKLYTLLMGGYFKIAERKRPREGYFDIVKTHTKTDEYCLYKNPGFDEALKAMKVLKPTLTEYEFAFTSGYRCEEYENDYEYQDIDLVTPNLYQEGADCVRYDDGSIYLFDVADPDVFTIDLVRLSIPIADIAANFDRLTEIMLTQK